MIKNVTLYYMFINIFTILLVLRKKNILNRIKQSFKDNTNTQQYNAIVVQRKIKNQMFLFFTTFERFNIVCVICKLLLFDNSIL